jgi:hypothetical protein
MMVNTQSTPLVAGETFDQPLEAVATPAIDERAQPHSRHHTMGTPYFGNAPSSETTVLLPPPLSHQMKAQVSKSRSMRRQM